MWPSTGASCTDSGPPPRPKARSPAGIWPELAAEFDGQPRSNTLKVLGLDLFSIGQIMPEGPACQVLDQASDGRFIRFVFDKHRLVGAILLGDMQLMSATKKAVEGQQDCSAFLQSVPDGGSGDRVFFWRNGTSETWVPARSSRA